MVTTNLNLDPIKYECCISVKDWIKMDLGALFQGPWFESHWSVLFISHPNSLASDSRKFISSKISLFKSMKAILLRRWSYFKSAWFLHFHSDINDFLRITCCQYLKGIPKRKFTGVFLTHYQEKPWENCSNLYGHQEFLTAFGIQTMCYNIQIKITKEISCIPFTPWSMLWNLVAARVKIN